MELVKKNILSILCGVVALAAVAFYFIGVAPKFGALHEEAAARAAKVDEFKQIQSAQRTLPALGEGQPKPLVIFPNKAAIGRVEQVVAQLHAQSQQIMDQAIGINRAGRELLVQGTLPRPVTLEIGFAFKNMYAAVLKRGGVPDARTTTPNLPETVLRSAEPPTEEEIAKARRELWEKQYWPLVVTVDGRPEPASLQAVGADYNDAVKDFDKEFRRKRANEYKVYLEPTALELAPSVVADPSKQPSPADMWYAQMALWVQRDVCQAVADLNNSDPSFRNIPTSPVKHLIKVDVRPDISMYARKGGTASSGGAPPAPGAEAADPSAAAVVPPVGLEVKDFTISPSGRVCNVLYDVVHFRLEAVVDAQAVKPFVQQLQHKRFFNVLEMDVQGVDLDEALDEGYEYGRRPVVHLRLKCEALFLRDWTAWVRQQRPDGTVTHVQGPMPLDVQKLLGVQQPAADAPAAPPTAVAGQ